MGGLENPSCLYLPNIMPSDERIHLNKLPRLEPRSGIKVMYASIRALILREVQTRFGQYRLGYLWVFLEPLLTMGVMFILFGTIREKVVTGIEFEIFLLNGIIPFYMFRTGITQSMGAVQSNKGLFSYQPVKPIDALLARNILELFLKVVAYIGFSMIFLWFGYHISFESIPTLIFYWVLLFIFMIANSLIFMVIANFSKEIEKFLSIIFLVVYLLSGILYPISIIPIQYREYLLFNPIIHVIELMRHAVAPSYALVQGISLSYFGIWIVGSLFLGLLLYKRFEKQMLKSK